LFVVLVAGQQAFGQSFSAVPSPGQIDPFYTQGFVAAELFVCQVTSVMSYVMLMCDYLHVTFLCRMSLYMLYSAGIFY